MENKNVLNIKVDKSWFLHGDVVGLGKQLLGKVLCTNFNHQLTKGIIVEVESYCGRGDKASHANNQKMTNRNKIMFEEGGRAYVYLCYGIHHLFNVVTNKKGLADAILVRAIEPVEGVSIMMERRKMNIIEKRLTSGPGVLSQALGITIHNNSETLTGDHLWIENGQRIPNEKIVETTRIGVDYAGEDALKPWRFYIKENKWVSNI